MSHSIAAAAAAADASSPLVRTDAASARMFAALDAADAARRAADAATEAAEAAEDAVFNIDPYYLPYCLGCEAGAPVHRVVHPTTGELLYPATCYFAR